MSPAGRLPLTFYQSVADLPPFSEYSMQGRTYRYFSGTPVYPFGYGLSYAVFSYRDARFEQGHVSVSVCNDKGPDAEEVVQVYVSPGHSAPRALVGIAKVRLEPGDATPVLVEVPARDLPTGEVEISVRASSRESRLSTTVTLEASEGHAVHS